MGGRAAIDRVSFYELSTSAKCHCIAALRGKKLANLLVTRQYLREGREPARGASSRGTREPPYSNSAPEQFERKI